MSTRTTPACGISSAKSPLFPHVFEPSQIEAIWPELEPFILASVEKSFGMQTVNQVHDLLLKGHAHAFCTMRDNRLVMVLVVRLIEYATFGAARIIACAGKELKEATQFISALEAWALTQGAVELEGWCRPAVARLVRRLGWRTKVEMVTLDLRRKLQ